MLHPHRARSQQWLLHVPSMTKRLNWRIKMLFQQRRNIWGVGPRVPRPLSGGPCLWSQRPSRRPSVHQRQFYRGSWKTWSPNELLCILMCSPEVSRHFLEAAIPKHRRLTFFKTQVLKRSSDFSFYNSKNKTRAKIIWRWRKEESTESLSVFRLWVCIRESNCQAYRRATTMDTSKRSMLTLMQMI